MAGVSKERMNEINKKTRFSGERAVEMGKKSVEVRKEKRTLKKMFEVAGDTKAPEAITKQLEKMGFDISSPNIVEAIVNILSVRMFDKKTSNADLVKFIELFAKYTGQEPDKNISLSGELGLKKVFITKDEERQVEEHIADVIGEY